MKWTWQSQVTWGVLVLAGVTAAFRLADGMNSGTESAQTAASPSTVACVSNAAGPTATAIADYPQALRLTFAADADGRPTVPRVVELCQFSQSESRTLLGVDCQSQSEPCREPTWDAAHPLPFQTYGQGEYIGPARGPHIHTYTLRVNDLIDFVYRFTHEEIPDAYRLIVGDEIMVETFPQEIDSIRRGDLNVGRGLIVQPDGTIVLPYVGSVVAAKRTVEEVRAEIEQRLTDPKNGKFNRGAVEVLVTPLKTNTGLEDLRTSVDARFGSGGQTRTATITPEGTVQLVGIGSVPAQGLTIPELEAEVNARYVRLVGRGVQVSTILRQFAPRFVWVAGEVVQPGQFPINQPLTVVQAIALARGFNNGGNVREIIVFRRDDNWQLLATRLDVRGVFVGRTPFPSDDIWLRDNDVVVVPKGPLLRVDELLNLVFARGLLSAFPYQNALGVNF